MKYNGAWQIDAPREIRCDFGKQKRIKVGRKMTGVCRYEVRSSAPPSGKWLRSIYIHFASQECLEAGGADCCCLSCPSNRTRRVGARRSSASRHNAQDILHAIDNNFYQGKSTLSHSRCAVSPRFYLASHFSRWGDSSPHRPTKHVTT